MEVIFFILISVLILFIYGIYNEKKNYKYLITRLKNQWGHKANNEYSSEKLKSIKRFFLSKQDDLLDIDDITWNDLDMDDIFMIINNTQSSIGEEYLYALLRKPCFSNQELEERNRLINFFQENEEERIQVQVKLSDMGKLSRISVYEYIDKLDELDDESNLPHYLMLAGLIISIGLIFINPGLGGTLTTFFAFNNIYRYYKKKAYIESYLTVFSYLLGLLDNSEKIVALDIPEIEKYTGQLKKDIPVFRNFKRGSFWLVSRNVTGSIMDTFLDYIRMLFHVDIIKFNSMISFIRENRPIINSIYSTIGYLDSCIAVASFRESLDYYCQPKLVKSSKPLIQVKDLYHPLLPEPIPNSIDEDRSVLITGSNASGKSTFIKTMALNTILSQTIYTSISREYNASFFIIYTSMALRDSIFRNESYYIVEIKSLKRILDRVNDDIPMLCFIDEVLRGTNTLERIAASSRILAHLAKENCLCFAATHDIELTSILENYFENYHFQERIEDNQVLFDYKLYSGRAVSRNAIKLLSLLGYSKDIIDDAENAANEFTNHGEWFIMQ